ncbi:MAG: hypothetical protein GWP58_14130, partial [Gammaproteobacteria bacterium]|nr:hypothetical protein [Gammaproteobacteria bacterium]
MNFTSVKKRFSLGLLGVLLITLAPAFGFAQDPSECTEEQEQCERVESSADSAISRTLGGPDQVENRLHIDSSQVTPMFPSDFARGYFNWKDRVREENGVGFGGDYSFAYLKASDSPGA